MFQARGHEFVAERVAEAIARDDARIPARQNREGYGATDAQYWMSGYVEYLTLTGIAARHGVRHGVMFDFGGSTGRVFRNFHYQGGWKVWANDFKRSSVEWNLANFPPAIRAFQGMYQPVLPIRSDTFDLIIALSVFTHIDETETNWLLELNRVLKPGGIALLTIHNEATWSDMGEGLRKAMETHSPDIASLPVMPADRIVSNFRLDDPYRCNVFHSDAYIRRQWSRFFDVLEILPRMSGAQAIVVLRRQE
jgi:SAM-dependent methyltransferase